MICARIAWLVPFLACRVPKTWRKAYGGMARWAGYMKEAQAAAKTDIEKARVELFSKAEWDPMVKAKAVYDAKTAR